MFTKKKKKKYTKFPITISNKIKNTIILIYKTTTGDERTYSVFKMDS